MQWQVEAYSNLVFIASAAMGIWAIVLVRRKNAADTWLIALAMLSSAIWAFGYVHELRSTVFETKLLWAKLQFIGIVFFPMAAFGAIMKYVGQSELLTRRFLYLSTCLSILTLILVFTNENHGFMWIRVEHVIIGAWNVLRLDYSYGLWIFFGYGYCLLLITGLLFYRHSGKAEVLKNPQIALVIVGLIFPSMASIMDATNLLIVDVTPLAFAVTASTLGVSLIRHDLGGLVPIAHDTVIRGMSDGIIVLDHADRIMEINLIAADVLGQDEASLIQKRLQDLWPNWPSMTAVKSEGHYFGFREKERYYDVRYSPLVDERGMSIGGVAVIRDITETTEAEIELRELRRFNDSVIETMSEGVVVEDLEGRFVFANPAAEALLGYAPGEMIGKHWTSIIAIEQQDAVREANKRRVKREIDRYELEVVRSDGSTLPVQVSGAPRFEGDTFIGTMAVFSNISERIQAERAIRDSHERFLTVMDGIDADIYVADMQTYEILFMNKHIRESFGEDLEGTLCWKSFRAGDVPCPHCTNKFLLDEQGRPAGVQIWEGHNPLTDRWYMNYDRAIEWVDGRLVRIQVATDITDRIKIEEEVRKRRDELEALRETSLAISAKLDLDEVLLNVVQRGCQLLDVTSGTIYLYEVDENELLLVVSYGLTRDYSGTRLQPGEGVAGAVFERGEAFSVQNYHAWDDQSESWSDEPLTAVLGIPLQVKGQIVGVMTFAERNRDHEFEKQDVHLASLFASQAAIAIENARLHSETETRLREQIALREAISAITSELESEQVLRRIAEQMCCAIDATSAYICSYEDASKTMTVVAEHISSEAADLEAVSDLGQSYSLLDDSDFVAKMNSAQPDFSHIDDAEITAIEREHLERYGGKSVLYVPIIMRGKLIAIAEVWESRAKREYSQEEIGLLQGISHQAGVAMENANLFNQVQQRAMELQRSNTELQQFAYVASHDLQEPLRMIRSYMGLLESRYSSSLDQDAQEFIGFAVDGAERMQELINGLLDYSRVETQGTSFELTDCGDAVGVALKNLELAIDETKAEIHTAKLPTILADRVQLIQLFQNLIGNAIKFRSSSPPQIEIGSERKNGEFVFHVRDNGIGIESKFHDRIFKIFQRLHTREQYPGAGIGLAVCKRIVERHGGRIWVSDSSMGGTTFSFSLEDDEADL